MWLKVLRRKSTVTFLLCESIPASWKARHEWFHKFHMMLRWIKRWVSVSISSPHSHLCPPSNKICLQRQTSIDQLHTAQYQTSGWYQLSGVVSCYLHASPWSTLDWWQLCTGHHSSHLCEDKSVLTGYKSITFQQLLLLCRHSAEI